MNTPRSATACSTVGVVFATLSLFGPSPLAAMCPTASAASAEQTVVVSESGDQAPQFGPAKELIVPLDFPELDSRLADTSVRTNAEPARLRVRLNNVMIYDAPASAIRVFLDEPNPSGADDELPGYLDSFAFFPTPQWAPSGQQVGSFVVDLDEAVAKLAQAERLPQHNHSLTIVPIDAEGRPTGRVAVGSRELVGG